MRQWLIFKVGYVYQIPQEGEGVGHIWPTVYVTNAWRQVSPDVAQIILKSMKMKKITGAPFLYWSNTVE